MYMWQSMDRFAIHALPHIHFLLFYQPIFAEPGQRFAGGLRSCDTHGDIMHCLYDRLQIRLEPVMVLTEIVQHIGGRFGQPRRGFSCHQQVQHRLQTLLAEARQSLRGHPGHRVVIIAERIHQHR